MSEPLRLLAAFAIFLFLIGRNLPAALLAAFPSLRRATETDDDGSLDPDSEPAAEKVVAELKNLGFVKLGAIAVRPPLAASQAMLVFGAPELHTFADLDAADGALRLTLFTPFQAGEAVLTSDHQRPARNDSDLLIGGLPQHEVASVFAAHRRRVAQLVEGPLHAVPWQDVTLAGRLEAERSFYKGAGKRLLRARGLLPALMIVTAILFLAIIALQYTRFARS